MEKIGHVRIDDRLIHGQIVASWINDLNCNTIVVADDKAANDEFQKSLLMMACPDTIQLKVLTLKDAHDFLLNCQNRPKVLCIIRDAHNALELIGDNDIEITKINVGNVSSGNGRKKYSKSVWLNDQDLEDYHKLAAKNIELEVQVIPSEKATNLLSMIK